MEPLFFKAENAQSQVLHASASRFNGAAFFQSGKFSTGVSFASSIRRLQWSRFFSKRKIVLSGAELRGRSRASMEPLFFKAENARNGAISILHTLRFNGAAFFQSGKSKLVERRIAIQFELQWSRFFSKRKISQSSPININTSPSFNGAAFFQSGKYVCSDS